MLVCAITQAQTLYWDTNGTDAGAGTTADGTWDDVTSNWTTDSTGASATNTYTSDSEVVFSAGSDVSTANVTMAADQYASSLRFEEGDVTVSGSAVLWNVATITVDSGATANIMNSWIRSNPTLVVEGTMNANYVGSGGSFEKQGSGTLTANRIG